MTRDIYGNAATIHAFHELTGGYFNAAYAIDLSDGQRYVLKVAPPDAVPVLTYERGIIHAEVEMMRLVRAQTSAPVPEILHFDPSRRLLGAPFFLMGWVEGAPLDSVRATLSPEAAAAIDQQVGAMLRQINAITGRAFGYIAPGATAHRRWRDAFLRIVAQLLDDGGALEVALPRPADLLLAQLAHCAGVLDEVATPHLVLWDLWDGNIFVDPATARVTGIIDFERALWGDPLMEHQFLAPEPPAPFVAGYGQPMLDTAARRQRRLLYNIHFYLILIIEDRARQYESSDLANWAQAQLDQALAALDSLCDGVR